VKHNSVDITDKVISYQREHRICSSIGTLNIILEGTYATAINPHNTIDIYENGDFKVRYYVSDVAHSVPDGTITLQCQDKSKYLVDYFIPDSYTIDYPSTTKYWIQKFLTEAGISYNFVTSSPGNLLSNYTALGLQPAYDQIMMLLQLSGWYMYFDGNGVAVIGSLNVDLAASDGNLGKSDILDIKKVSNDKMLRNRALVWGQYDPFRQEYAFADVTKHTRWDYDSRDIRTMVVSNQNIPNSSSAYSIANVLLKEFAKITVEKHIVATGARNYNLGNSIRVNSHVWRGKGLITTFGVNMDRNGLVTTIVLDERCPRLFGFFDFGDYVYVGTFGDGVWRKHIKFDSTWYDFSTGLLDLNITDLHINNGIFGAVGHSGQMYYANSEEGPWYEIPTITGLQSSLEDNVTGSGVEMTAFSGIMARAVIVDKITNIVRFGVDTWSGENTGDYFMTYSGILGTSSGVVTSSGDQRGWIVEYDPYTGELFTNETSSGVYPISYSGNYDMRVLDLENDGVNDYVSVRTGGAILIQHTSLGYNFGKFESQAQTIVHDYDNLVSYDNNQLLNLEGQSIDATLAGNVINSVYNNDSIGEREIVYYYSSGSDKRFKRLSVTKSFDITIGRDRLASTTLISPAIAAGSYIAVHKLAADSYRFYSLDSAADATTISAVIKYRDWDAALNTVGAIVTVDTLTITKDLAKGSNVFSDAAFKVINGKISYFVRYWGWAHDGITTDVSNYIKIYVLEVSLAGGTSLRNGLVHQQNYHNADGTLGGKNWGIFSLSNGLPGPTWLFQNGRTIAIAMMVKEWNQPVASNADELNNYILYSNDGSAFNNTLIQTTTTSTDATFLLVSGVSESNSGGSQLSNSGFIQYHRNTTTGVTYIYNGTSLTITIYPSDVPFQWKASKIIPIFGYTERYYLALNGTDWNFCNYASTAVESTFVFPPKYTPIHPFSTSGAVNGTYFWSALDNDTGRRVLLRTTHDSVINAIDPFSVSPFSGTRGIMSGNFFLDTAGRWLYLDNKTNVPDSTAGYLLLQREGTEFNLIRTAARPIRVDISNNSPVVTNLDIENTFQSAFIFNQEVTTVIPTSGLDTSRQVRDYRYTSLETTSSGTIVGSGAGIETQILYVSQNGVYYSDASTYSGGFVLFDVIPSGSAERIETTNYVYPGQFIFVTTSGDDPMFYQRDNDEIFFTAYSGLPNSRICIIRTDDRL
jgi:hypothetical protein